MLKGLYQLYQLYQLSLEGAPMCPHSVIVTATVMFLETKIHTSLTTFPQNIMSISTLHLNISMYEYLFLGRRYMSRKHVYSLQSHRSKLASLWTIKIFNSNNTMTKLHHWYSQFLCVVQLCSFIVSTRVSIIDDQNNIFTMLVQRRVHGQIERHKKTRINQCPSIGTYHIGVQMGGKLYLHFLVILV